MTHSFTQSFTHSLTQEQDNANRLHLSPTTEHHTNSHPAPSLELKLASLRRSQPARKSSTPHTPQPLQLPNDVVSMAKLGVFFSVFFPPVSVFMVTMLPLVLLGVGMSHNTVPRNRYNMQNFFLVDTFCHQPILLIDAVSLFFIISVAVFYVLTWVVYAQTAARPLKFSSFPWDPRRILKLNRILFLSTIPTNISLIPVAFSLIKYRLWTMRGSQGLV